MKTSRGSTLAKGVRDAELQRLYAGQFRKAGE